MSSCVPGSQGELGKGVFTEKKGMHWCQGLCSRPNAGSGPLLLCITRHPFFRSHWLAAPNVIMIWSCWYIMETPLQSVLWWRRETLRPLQVSTAGEETWRHLWVAAGTGAQGDTRRRGIVGHWDGNSGHSDGIVWVLVLQGGVLGTLW